MSHRSHPHHEHSDVHGRVHGGSHHGRQGEHPYNHHDHLEHQGPDDRRTQHGGAPRRQKPAPGHRRHAERPGLSVELGGKLVRVGPVAFWTVVGTLVIMATWTLITATYFAFHDDVLARLIAREAAMQFAYEDRIAEMRIMVDRATSRQMLDQEQFEQKLEQLQRRQSVLESRATTLGAVIDPVTTGSIKMPARGAADRPTTPSLKPAPISDTVIRAAPPDREVRVELRGVMAPPPNAQGTTGGIEGTLARMQESLNRVEARQASTLNSLEEGYDAKARRMRSVLADLSLDAGRTTPQVGGPFVPAKPPSEGSFERQLYRISLARAQVDRLNRTLAAVPIRKPVTADIDTSSVFGIRIDPFYGRPAMHTGLDFRGTVGDPIHATAGGIVVHAGWSGGYGNIVEIDHGNGLSTRYGHLSEIETSVGQSIKTGQVIGRLGSSGRSTGPHLHYETRVDGEAVDPERFLRAGIRLGGSS
jgi:murein DD-endopeptidase MepM/ murein hydrolase activator NlpD